MSPIFVVADAASRPQPHDYFALLIASIAPAATVLIFFAGTWITSYSARKQRELDRERDRQLRNDEIERDRVAREAEKDRDRSTRHLDMKREVFLEACPALMRAYHSLGLFFNPNVTNEKIAEEFSGIRDSMSKIQAVASDATLSATQPLVVALGKIHMRLLSERVLLHEGGPIETYERLLAIWRADIAAIPPLWGDFLERARSEIFLDFDKALFVGNVTDANAQMSEMLDELLVSIRARNDAQR